MKRDPEQLQFYSFNSNDFLVGIKQVQQLSYIKKYLSADGLNAKSVIEEPYYFDRDYLDEFAHFYSTSSNRYENVCRRIHIFDSSKVNETLFKKALQDDAAAHKILQKSYLGFIVIRPLPHAPLGRTVLRWYPDSRPNTRRVTKTSRSYKTHIAGIQLQVDGLAWQQQDEGVSSCSTIGLWSLLHASAFDDFHQIPTTAQITISAHDNYSEGRVPFPTFGLTPNQICDSIIHYGLRPARYTGDLINHEGQSTNYKPPFSKRLFSHLCGSLLRSGYPMLLIGKQFHKVNNKVETFDHAICLVGFRENVVSTSPKKQALHYDENIKYIYVHDDNLGPNVRFEIIGTKNSFVHIEPSAPQLKDRIKLFDQYIKFIPTEIIVGVNNELRVAPQTLYEEAYKIADCLLEVWQSDMKKTDNISFGIQFFKITDYFGHELPLLLGNRKAYLGDTRRRLIDEIPPLSLHIGVIRLGVGGFRVFDILCDTSQAHPEPYAVLCFHSMFKQIVQNIGAKLQINFEDIIDIPLDKN